MYNWNYRNIKSSHGLACWAAKSDFVKIVSKVSVILVSIPQASKAGLQFYPIFMIVLGYFADTSPCDINGVPSPANILPVAVALDCGTTIPSTSGITNSPRNVITHDPVLFATFGGIGAILINLGCALGHITFGH